MTDRRSRNRLPEPAGARAGITGLAVAAVLFLAPVVAGADEDAASRALDGAFDVVEQARATASLEERWTLYETAARDLRRIIEKFPDSDVARRLTNSGSADGANYADLKRALLTTGKAVCERRFDAACVLRFAGHPNLFRKSFNILDVRSDIAKMQAMAGDIAGAFATIEKVNRYAWSDVIPAIIAVAVADGDLTGALAAADGIAPGEARDIAHLSLVRELIDAGDLADGRRVAARIRAAGDRARALALLAGATAAGRSGGGGGESSALFAEALDLAATLDAGYRRAALLFEIGALQLSADHFAQARDTLAAALDATRALTNPSNRHWVLAVLREYAKEDISAAARAVTDEFRRAAAQMDELRDSVEDVLDDAQTRIGSGDFGGAEALLERAREMAPDVPEGFPRDDAYARMVTLRLNMGDIDGALTDWTSMSGQHSTNRALAEIARAQAMAGDMEGLRRLLEISDKLERGFGPYPILRYVISESLIGEHIVPALAEIGMLTEARELAARIVEHYYFLGVAMTAIAKHEAAAGDFDAATATARSLPNVTHRAAALREIAAEQLRRGRAAEAKALLLEAFRAMFDAGGILAVDHIAMADLGAFRDIGRLLAEVEAGGSP